MTENSARPLAGQRIVVTRSAEQAGEFSERLRALGAEPIEVPTIAIVDPADGGAALAAAVRDLGAFDRIVVASTNGARRLLAALDDAGVDQGPPVACVGPATAAVLSGSALVVDVVPATAVAEGLVEALGPPSRRAGRALVVSAHVSRPALVDGLRAAGWQVERVAAYRSVDAEITPEAAAQCRDADVITFTSSSTVERFLRLAGRDAFPPVIASIGPITSATARDLGLTVTTEADPHTLDGLLAGLCTRTP